MAKHPHKPKTPLRQVSALYAARAELERLRDDPTSLPDPAVLAEVSRALKEPLWSEKDSAADLARDLVNAAEQRPEPLTDLTTIIAYALDDYDDAMMDEFLGQLQGAFDDEPEYYEALSSRGFSNIEDK